MTSPELPLGDEVLTLQEAADQLRVHYMTAYRWVRRGTLPAFKAGGRLRVRTSDLQRFARDREVDVALHSAGTGRRDWGRHVDRLHLELLEGHAVEAGNLVQKVIADGAAATDVYVHLITPALHRIGEDWARGAIGIATEHRATEIAWRLVARLGESFRRRGPRRGTAVTLTPSGEQHALGLAMVADYLRGLGYAVHHLGTSVPLADLTRFLERSRPDLVCLSITYPQHNGDGLERIVSAVHALDGPRVVIGGQGADRAAVTATGAAYVAGLTALGPAIGV